MRRWTAMAVAAAAAAGALAVWPLMRGIESPAPVAAPPTGGERAGPAGESTPWRTPAAWTEPASPAAATGGTAGAVARPSSATTRVDRVRRPAPASSADAIPGERVLSFYSAAERDAFLKMAGEAGVTVLGYLRLGNAVRVRVGAEAAWQALLAKAPTPVEQAPNVRMHIPPVPAKASENTLPRGGYVAFGSEGVAFSGGSLDRRDWGRGALVAVLDTGAASGLAAGQTLSRVDLVGGEGSGEHGTAVTSLIAGRGARVVGVAPGADVISIRVASEAGGDAFTLAQGIVEAADRGARVINVCLASRGDNFIVREAVRYAQERGALIVAGVGNDGVPGVSYPAAYEGVLAVSGVDRFGRHLGFANTGSEVAIAAPGVGVWATGATNEVVWFSGTSAAAPFVSGAAAALRARYPDLTAGDVTAILRTSARDSGEPGSDSVFGAGVLDIRRAMDWNRRGVFDAAVGSPYVLPFDSADRGSSRREILLPVQNRGTERLARLTLEVEVDGVPSVIPFHNLEVGESTAHRLSVALPPGDEPRTVALGYRAVLDGVSDAHPADNEKRGSLRIGRAVAETL